jgi:hypothetical protein
MAYLYSVLFRHISLNYFKELELKIGAALFHSLLHISMSGSFQVAVDGTRLSLAMARLSSERFNPIRMPQYL